MKILKVIKMLNMINMINMRGGYSTKVRKAIISNTKELLALRIFLLILTLSDGEVWRK